MQKCYDLSLPVYLFQQDNLEELIGYMTDCDTIVDAIFGFGLNSSPRGIYQSVIESINQLYDQEVIAVDIPTGLHVIQENHIKASFMQLQQLL